MGAIVGGAQFTFAGIGIDRLVRGDQGGLITLLLDGSVGIGLLIGSWLPLAPDGPDSSPDDTDWDAV